MPDPVCPSPAALSGFVLGTLPEPELEKIARHLDDCPACEAAVASLEDISSEQWERTLRTNITSFFLVTREALRHMQARKRGHIAIIGSHAANRAFTDCGGYTAAKAGQLGLVRVLAEEARPYDIRVTALLPGATDTPIWDDRPGFDRSKMMRPEDVASFLLAILGNSASLVTIGNHHELVTGLGQSFHAQYFHRSGRRSFLKLRTAIVKHGAHFAVNITHNTARTHLEHRMPHFVELR